MSEFDLSNRFGWESSARAWLETVENDANRTHLLDDWMLGLVADVEGRQVLDLGCGEGRFCRMLARIGARCVGLDPVESFLKFSNSIDAKVPVVRGSGESLPFQSCTFDLAVAYLSLIDIPDLRRAVFELHRVLRPGGRIVVATIHPMTSAIPGWKKDEMGSREYWRVDNYFRETGDVAAWNGISILNWHRPLETYMQAFLSTGLRLVHFGEPKPNEQQVEQRPQIADHLRVPNFLTMVWQK